MYGWSPGWCGTARQAMGILGRRGGSWTVTIALGSAYVATFDGSRAGQFEPSGIYPICSLFGFPILFLLRRGWWYGAVGVDSNEGGGPWSPFSLFVMEKCLLP